MIYNDINDSTYVYNYDDLSFYFSSEFYKEKFIKEHADFLKEETIKLKIKFRCNICFDYLILLLLYQKIEKRGFKVIYKNKEIDNNYYFECSLRW